MSGRRLGRLLGSLLAIAAAAAIAFNAGAVIGAVHDYQAQDIIWTLGPNSSADDGL
ncbi:hypothetical protein [Micromonospora sp. NPDC050495]|uniref:hypothetical protein n=1 Tax=Micromonospora sp. NPDC050495 TaxID=3154936 RepID=UPI0033EC040C